MTYMFDIRSFVVSFGNLLLERAAAKASSWNGFGCVRYFVRPLQVLVRAWTTRALAWPGVRWHVKLRQEGPYPWASGAIAYNVWRIRDVALIRMLNQGTKPNVPYLLYAVMCWAVYQH
jgi:hypothetical protein